MNLKEVSQRVLISLMGFRRYLYLVAWSRIISFRSNPKQNALRHFVSLIPNERGIILDIGANIGYITKYLATEKPLSDIFSFEPIPDNYWSLEKVIRKFKLKNVKSFNIGLGNENTTLKMIMPIVKGVKKHARSRVESENSKYKEATRFSVDIKKLDDFAAATFDADEKILAIKIDVENYEYNVFKGGYELLKKNRPKIFCEFWNSENKYKIIDMFNSLNYDIKLYINGNLVTYSDDLKNGGNNFFLLPR